MRPAHYIETDSDLRDLISRLEDVPALALDTESNSFYVYFEKVCLVQLSTDDEDFALDPFKVDLRALGPLLANPKIELVIHAADYDIRCLKRDFGFTFANLFDTMLAAKVLGYDALGLSSLLQKELGITHPKEHQRSDWGRRPLSAEQLSYAYLDTAYLLPLSHKLLDALRAANRLDEARRLFARQAACVPRPKRFDPNDYRLIKGVRALDPDGRAVAKALFVLREELAQSWDRPPFKVFGNEAIVAMAQSRPVTLEALGSIKGVGASTIQRAGTSMVEAVARALTAPRT